MRRMAAAVQGGSSVLVENAAGIPAIGLGTWNSMCTPERVRDAVVHAVRDCGYRAVDTAALYGNERFVGEAFRELFAAPADPDADEAEPEALRLTREDVFVTSKLWNDAHRPDQVMPALRKTLDDLGLAYLDLYLMHWPCAFHAESYRVHLKENGEGLDRMDFTIDHSVSFLDTWRAMEELVDAGLCRHIGVSNFSVEELRTLLAECRIRPVANQVELHPYLSQERLVRFCKAENVHPVAYRPLGIGKKAQAGFNVADNPVIRRVAHELGKPPLQVVLRWNVQRGISVIPKSFSKEHLAANMAALDASWCLTDEHMQAIADVNFDFRFVRPQWWSFPFDDDDFRPLSKAELEQGERNGQDQAEAQSEANEAGTGRADVKPHENPEAAAHLQRIEAAREEGAANRTVRIAATPIGPGAGASAGECKRVWFVRHGQGAHNVLAARYRAREMPTSPYTSEACPVDPVLSTAGYRQAEALQPDVQALFDGDRAGEHAPQLFVTSPMRRAIQTGVAATAALQLPDGVPPPAFVAVELAHEQGGHHVCDRRLGRTQLQDSLSQVDFSELEEEQDPFWGDGETRETTASVIDRAYRLMLWIRAREEQNVLVFTHSSFLHSTFNAVLDCEEAPELRRWFATGEMRGVHLQFIDP